MTQLIKQKVQHCCKYAHCVCPSVSHVVSCLVVGGRLYEISPCFRDLARRRQERVLRRAVRLFELRSRDAIKEDWTGDLEARRINEDLIEKKVNLPGDDKNEYCDEQFDVLEGILNRCASSMFQSSSMWSFLTLWLSRRSPIFQLSSMGASSL